MLDSEASIVWASAVVGMPYGRFSGSQPFDGAVTVRGQTVGADPACSADQYSSRSSAIWVWPTAVGWKEGLASVTVLSVGEMTQEALAEQSWWPRNAYRSSMASMSASCAAEMIALSRYSPTLLRK